MNWIKENKIFFFTLLFILGGCKFKSETDLLTAKWHFKSIIKNGNSVVRITETDYLELKSDSTFQYQLNFINVDRKGKWSYKNHEIKFKYLMPDTIRTFKVEILSNKHLKFNENNIEFNLTKEN